MARFPVLESFVLKILEHLKDSISKVPYGIRWLCKATKLLVQVREREREREREERGGGRGRGEEEGEREGGGRGRGKEINLTARDLNCCLLFL